MSKFFITNSVPFFQRVKLTVEASAYRPAFEFAGGGIFCLTTRKLTVDNKNGVKCGDGFAMVTGTMAWARGEPISVTALEKIHRAFNGDVSSIRRNAIGNFAAAILKAGSLYVFGETAGFYNIFFYHVDDSWLLSNSLYDMAAVLEGRLTLDRLNLVESIVQDGIMLGGTHFKEVMRLSGFDYLKITGEAFEAVEEETLYPMAGGSGWQKVDQYRQVSKSYGRRMSSAYGPPVISTTGGLDARMVLSSYLAAGVKPHLYYGTGNSFVTNTYQEDRDIDRQFAEKLVLTFHEESWATPDPLDRYWDRYLSLYGYYYDTYAGAEDFMESLKNTPCQLVTFGYCGELLRNLPWIEARRSSHFTLKEYLHEFYLPENVRRQVVDADTYEQHIWNKLVRICRLYHLDPEHIASEDIFYLSLERRKSSDAALVNLANFMKYCTYPLGQYENLLAGRATCAEMANSSFMLHCMDALCPSVLDIPVFSRCTLRRFHRDTMSLEPAEAAVTARIKTVIKHYFPWITIDIAKRILGRKRDWRFANDEAIYRYALLLFDRYDTLGLVHRNKFDDKRHLIKYVMKMYALRATASQT